MFRYICGCNNIKYFRSFSSESITTNRQVLSDLLGISIKEASWFIEKYELQHKDSEVLSQNIQLCQSFGYANKDIIKMRGLFTLSPLELEHHYYALEEGGFHNINAKILSKSRKYMKKLVPYLKSCNFIHESTNVPEKLLSYIEDQEIANKIPINFRDDEYWGKIHLEIMKTYLKFRLKATTDEINNLLRVHNIIKNKSFRVVQENIKLAESLGFDHRKIIKHGYVIGTYTKYTKTTLRDLHDLAGLDMRKAMKSYPKLFMTPPKNIIKIYGILKEFDISDACIQRQPNVFHMSPATVKLRLQEIEKSPDLKVLLNHPKILSLIIYHKRAKTRLSFLQQLELKCAPLTILRTDFTDEFDEYIKDGKDINKKQDLIYYLEKLLLTSNSITKKEIYTKIRRHPFYLHVPIKDMQATFDYLIKNRFTANNIYKVLYILLYPKEKVTSTHISIKYDTKYNYSSLSQISRLNLILYLIEREHHFTGNGIWTKCKIENEEKAVI